MLSKNRLGSLLLFSLIVPINLSFFSFSRDRQERKSPLHLLPPLPLMITAVLVRVTISRLGHLHCNGAAFLYSSTAVAEEDKEEEEEKEERRRRRRRRRRRCSSSILLTLLNIISTISLVIYLGPPFSIFAFLLSMLYLY